MNGRTAVTRTRFYSDHGQAILTTNRFYRPSEHIAFGLIEPPHVNAHTDLIIELVSCSNQTTVVITTISDYRITHTSAQDESDYKKNHSHATTPTIRGSQRYTTIALDSPVEIAIICSDDTDLISSRRRLYRHTVPDIESLYADDRQPVLLTVLLNGPHENIPR